jgi:hypothetical protein
MTTTLAEIAVQEGLVAAPRLDAAREAAARSGEPLVVALIELEGVDEKPLAVALARRLGVAIADLGVEPIDIGALQELPQDLAQQRRIVPLTVEKERGSRVLRLAMADPTDGETVTMVEKTCGLKVIPVLAQLGAIDDALLRVYRGLDAASLKTEETTLPEDSPKKRRVPFGGNLPSISTPVAQVGSGILSTEPFHRVEEEATVEMRLRALLTVLESKGLVSMDEYIAELRALLHGRE